MGRALFASLLVSAATLVIAVSPALAAGDVDGEFGGLALGKDIQTDCSVSTVYKGKTYCFGNETAKSLFLKRPEDFLLQAHVYYNSKQGSQDKQ
jgi:YHS domain-containing protein